MVLRNLERYENLKLNFDGLENIAVWIDSKDTKILKFY